MKTLDFKQERNISKFFILLYSFIIFVIVNILMIYIYLFNYRDHVITESKVNIFEYEEIDLSHLCQMFECTYIQNDGVLYKNLNAPADTEKMARLQKTQQRVVIKMALLKDVYMTSNFDFLFTMKFSTSNYLYDGFVVIEKENIVNIVNNRYYILLTIVISSNIIMLLLNFLSIRRNRYKENIMLQYEGYYKSMMMLTENIHHEINTPLSVIKNKVAKLKHKNDNYCTLPGKNIRCTNESTNDFNMIDASLSQVSDLLDRMRPFKNIKEQNNRDLKTVIRTSCDIMLVSQHEKFDYNIMQGFENFNLNSDQIKSGEFTAILLNFIKNSLDANSRQIVFKIDAFSNNLLTFFVIDDGNGIPEHLQENIFKENVSSKSKSRGHGLYINRFIIESAKGNISLVHSSTKGTVFKITVPATIKDGNK